MPTGDFKTHVDNSKQSTKITSKAQQTAEVADRTFAAAVKILDRNPFTLQNGAILPQLEISYETWGVLSPERDNVVLVCPAFSAHCHANSHSADPEPGWWEGMIGPGCAFDTERFFVVCPSLLGGACGTTGPRSIDPETGQVYGDSFPIVSVRDIVDVHMKLLNHLGIERLFAACGGSLGAMQTMELAIRYPTRVDRAVAISGTDYTRPYTAAIRHLGRRAIQLGRSDDGGRTEDGLRLAREIGTLFYRSRREFNGRFSSKKRTEPSLEGLTFEVQEYLDYQGKKAVAKFDVDSYLTLSMAMDLQDVWNGFRSRRDALETVTAEFLIVGAEQDCLIPIDEQHGFHQALVAAGKRSSWRVLASNIGHDAFLAEVQHVGQLINEFFTDETESSVRSWETG